MCSIVHCIRTVTHRGHENNVLLMWETQDVWIQVGGNMDVVWALNKAPLGPTHCRGHSVFVSPSITQGSPRGENKALFGAKFVALILHDVQKLGKGIPHTFPISPHEPFLNIMMKNELLHRKENQWIHFGTSLRYTSPISFYHLSLAFVFHKDECIVSSCNLCIFFFILWSRVFAEML